MKAKKPDEVKRKRTVGDFVQTEVAMKINNKDESYNHNQP